MPFLTHESGRVEYQQAGAGRALVLLHSLLADRPVFDAVLPASSERTSTLRFASRMRSTSITWPSLNSSSAKTVSSSFACSTRASEPLKS